MALFGRRREARPDPSVAIGAGAASATGGRTDNQDRSAVTPRWAVVSDGAGGHAGGARAAELTVAAIADSLRPDPPADGHEDVLRAAVARANAAVVAGRHTEAGAGSMAATVTVALAVAVAPEGSTWLVANVGDSPAWLVTPDRVERLTNEHNLAGDLVRAGILTAEEARGHPGRHRITRAMGIEEVARPDLVTVALDPGDALVLASDGIEVLTGDEVAELTRRSPEAGEAARRLVDEALARRTPDNVTVVVLRHLASADAPPPTHPLAR